MANRLPSISDKYKICVICEGNEEYKYLEKLINLCVWNPQYDVSLVNAGGNGNIPARYQDRYQNGTYDVVFIFCDTEKKPYEQYEDIKRKINEFHGVDTASDEVIIFANPCTLQVVSKHWTGEMIKSPAKKVNSALVEKYTGIKDYKGRADQIEKMMESITVENYAEMRRRITFLSEHDHEIGSTNISRLLQSFENENAEWIDMLNNRLD